MKKLFEKRMNNLKHQAEAWYFRRAYLSALPTWWTYRQATPDPTRWDYSALLESLERYETIRRPTSEQVQKHQDKWAERVFELSKIYSTRKVLEVGCGEGLLVLRLHQKGLQVYANDVVNILHPSVVEAGICFEEGDVCQGLPYPEANFDMVYAVNSFEHFHDPAAALDEMLRVLRPGGLVFLTFDPLYYSPWGLHANRRLGIPYPQILFSKDTLQRLVDERRPEILATYSQGSDTTQIGPPLNEYSIHQYRKIFRERKDRMRLLAYVERTCLDGTRLIRQHPGIFKWYAPSFEDLIVSGVKLLGLKTGP